MLKQNLIGLVSGVMLLVVSHVNAGVLGDSDDSYFGFQITIPLDSGRKKIFSKNNEYSLMLINQTDGIKDGLVFTRKGDENQILGYIRPSNTFEIGRSKVSDFAMPILILDKEGDPYLSQMGEAPTAGMIIAGIAVVGGLIWLLDEIGESAAK